MSDRKTAIFILRAEAASIGQRLSNLLQAQVIRAYDVDETPKTLFRKLFADYERWVLIMSAGIAVRFLDGLPQDKQTDPAVVVLDEGCHHAISLLAGHEGGANELAFAVANAACATPVVSTATEATKRLVVGIGCRKGVSEQQIAEAVENALDGYSLQQVRCVATVEAKANEQGLLEFCLRRGLPLRIFAHDDVAARAWVTAPSAWVKSTLGLDGVCEPCALMATPRGRLVVAKTKFDGVSVAVVEDGVRLG